jgi:hypothetical protein
LGAEALFNYEHGSDYKIGCKTHDKLLAEVSDEDFAPYELPGRIRCDKLEDFLQKQKPDLRSTAGKTALRSFFEPVIPDAQKFVDELADFIHIEAKLPSSDKNFIPAEPIKIPTDYSREQIIDYLRQIRKSNTTADLAFYAYRDMESCDWVPFVNAAVERNPVSVQMVNSKSLEEVYRWLQQMNSVSIYDSKRLAQPDEVANYKTADGLEKAFLLADVIREKNPEQDIKITVDNDVVVIAGRHEYRFLSAKGLQKQVCIFADGAITIED